MKNYVNVLFYAAFAQTKLVGDNFIWLTTANQGRDLLFALGKHAELQAIICFQVLRHNASSLQLKLKSGYLTASIDKTPCG